MTAMLTPRSLGPYARRDRLVCWLCNLLLRHVASARYEAMIGGSIRLGIKAAVTDALTTSDCTQSLPNASGSCSPLVGQAVQEEGT